MKILRKFIPYEIYPDLSQYILKWHDDYYYAHVSWKDHPVTKNDNLPKRGISTHHSVDFKLFRIVDNQLTTIYCSGRIFTGYDRSSERMDKVISGLDLDKYHPKDDETMRFFIKNIDLPITPREIVMEEYTKSLDTNNNGDS